MQYLDFNDKSCIVKAKLSRFENGLLYMTPYNENMWICFNNVSFSAKENVRIKMRIRADIDTQSPDKRFVLHYTTDIDPEYKYINIYKKC